MKLASRPAIVLALSLLCLSSGCTRIAPPDACSLDRHAHDYVELVAALADRDPKSVDLPMPRPTRQRTSGEIKLAANDLVRHLRSVHQAAGDAARVQPLVAQLVAIGARAEQVGGARLSFDDEHQRLFGLSGAQPEADAADRATLDRLDDLLPGAGPLDARLAAYQRRFLVALDRLPAVMARAVRVCRDETLKHVALPPDELLTIQYTDGASWSGYSRYQGKFHSIMEINRQFALPLDRVLTLACHEGYPGHHTMSSLRDQRLGRERGWFETSVAPLFSPESYALEAMASAVPALLFSEAQRANVEREMLFPLAGLDRSEADRYVRVNRLVDSLDLTVFAITERYLTRHLDTAGAAVALRREAAMAEPEATLRFIDEYRVYSTAYTRGRLAAAAAFGSPAEPAETRWQRFVSMTLAGSLVADGATD